MPRTARAYIGAITAAGAAILAAALLDWRSERLLQFAFYVLFAALSSRMKVNLPGITGTMSVSFIFILMSAVALDLSKTVLVGCVATVVQCCFHFRLRPKPVQVIFNVGSSVLSTACCCMVYDMPWLRALNSSTAMMLFWATWAYFLVNTFSIAGVIALTEGKRVWTVWHECFLWTAPQYLVGAGLAWGAERTTPVLGWEASVLVLPAIFLIERSYRLYLGRVEQEKRHVENVSELHLRTIRALALAIDAKDQNTHDHLRRVQVYATEVAKEMGASEELLQALNAAALLHDIGKLAVPEYIISKPGRLTPEEFEKMKVHPVVGAEILETVGFPYPVVPIVKHHHEKWNGTGYPEGLKGEQIPLGARILAAVDCLDALASDRQYRRALPLEKAMQVVVSESGSSYDPRVVRILQERYLELEAQAKQIQDAPAALSSRANISAGHAPAAGFEESGDNSAREEGSDFISSIAAARQEFQMLHEVTRDLGNSLSMEQTLSLLAARLKSMIPSDAIVMYVVEDGRLVPQYVEGQDARLFRLLRIPLGQGLSGWVAENKKAIVNGNPSVEPGYLNDPRMLTTLRSAMSVPLEGVNGTVGVMTLYRTRRDAFTKDHLRILLAISSKAGLTIENALEYRHAQASAVTDSLTGLFNARSLFKYLEGELARSSRNRNSLAVLVLDLDGFKKVNDRFGHLQGNKVLQLVAQRIKQTCRTSDCVARMGGDEFVIVLGDANPAAVENRARTLQQIVAEAGRQVTGEDVLSLSIGQAFFPQDGGDAEELIAKADKRMYQMKQIHHLRAQPAAELALDRSESALLQ